MGRKRKITTTEILAPPTASKRNTQTRVAEFHERVSKLSETLGIGIEYELEIDPLIEALIPSLRQRIQIRTRYADTLTRKEPNGVGNGRPEKADAIR